MKKLSRRDVVYRVALAGVSSALALLLVWLGVVVRFSTAAFFFAAGLVLMIPLGQKYYASSALAYIASSALAFLIVGDIVSVSGYILYFGPMALLSGVLKNLKAKWYVAYPIKIAFINGILAALYFGLGAIVLPETLGKGAYALVATVGTVLLLALDAVSLFAYKTLSPRVAKVLRQNEAEPSATDEVVEDPFENDDDFYRADIYPKSDDKTEVDDDENSQDKNGDDNN